MSLLPENFRSEQLKKVVGGELHIKGTYTIKIPKEVEREANKILRSYLEQARRVLRIMGGDTELPLIKAGTRVETKRYWEPRGVPILPKAKNHDLNCIAKRVFIQDHTPDTMADVFNISYWRLSTWENIYTRTRNTLKPHLIRYLLESKMEDQNDRRDSRDGNQDVELQQTG